MFLKNVCLNTKFTTPPALINIKLQMIKSIARHRIYYFYYSFTVFFYLGSAEIIHAEEKSNEESILIHQKIST